MSLFNRNTLISRGLWFMDATSFWNSELAETKM